MTVRTKETVFEGMAAVTVILASAGFASPFVMVLIGLVTM